MIKKRFKVTIFWPILFSFLNVLAPNLPANTPTDPNASNPPVGATGKIINFFSQDRVLFKATTTQLPVLTISNPIASTVVIRMLWICTSSATATVTTVFHVIKNSTLTGARYVWYNALFPAVTPLQASLALVDISATKIANGMQMFSIFNFGASASNLPILSNDLLITLTPGEYITITANTISTVSTTTADVNVSFSWMESSVKNSLSNKEQ